MVWHLGAPLCHVNELQVLRYDPSAAVMAIGKQDRVCWFPPAEPSMALPKAELVGGGGLLIRTALLCLCFYGVI